MWVCYDSNLVAVFTDVVIFCCRFYRLPFLPVAVFSVALFTVADFTVAVFTVYPGPAIAQKCKVHHSAPF